MVRLMYASNTRVHRETKLSPFTVILSWQPSGSASPSSIHLTPDAEHVDLAMVSRIACIRWEAKLKWMDDIRLAIGAEVIWTKSRQRGLFEVTFALWYYVFVARPPLSTTAAERLAGELLETAPPSIGFIWSCECQTEGRLHHARRN